VVFVILAVLLTPRAASDPSFFVQILVYGFANGAIYALIALGYSPLATGVRLLPWFATPMIVSPAAGAALMAHDWHDRALWFRRGQQRDV